MLTFCVNFKVDDKLGLDPCFYFCVCANDFVSLLISWTFLTDVASGVLVKKKGSVALFCVCSVSV